ncbi:MAG: DNA translocase FtsK 4TM domain-containing protein [Acidimicrobiia bacterium]
MARSARRRRRSTRGRSRASRRDHLRASLADQLGAHRADALAIALLVFAALTALGLLSDLAGPLGQGLARASSTLFGRGEWLVPLVACALAVALLWRHHGEDEDEAEAPQVLRIGVGVTLVLVSMVGLLHLHAGNPSVSGPVDALRTAGGYGGALVASPLHAVGGTVGAAIVLVSLGVFGALLTPGIPLSRVFAAVGAGLRLAGERIKAYVELAERAVNDHDDAADGDTPTLAVAAPGAPEARVRRATVELYDQMAEPRDGTVVDLPAEEAGEEDGEEDEEYEELAEDEEYEEEDEDEEYEEEDEDEEYEEEDEDEEYEEEDEDEEYEEEDEDDVAAEGGAAHQMAIDLGPAYAPVAWKLPAKTVLKRGTTRSVDERMIEDGGRVLESTLHEFGVDATLIGMTVGPTVTRYELELAPGVKVNKVTSLSHDIAYAMASADVRILAPIPGRSAIGVEVPNKQRQLVTLGDILASDEASRASHPLEVGLGRDISGRSVMLNLATMPHLLIAGSTGAGKSSCINSIITSILMRSTPDQVRLILVDPKRVELGAYNDVPHLLTPVVTNPKKAANALDWAVREMDMRYELLSEAGVRDITGYNAAYDRGELPTAENPDPISGKGYNRLPFILVVVDELNDLMMVAARDVEASICRIAQMARAVGIHLIIATQRPSVDVITGVIKANVPSRMAFSVTSLADSRVILDQPGAEKLIGQGDLLIVTASSSRAQRIQGAWVDEECVRKVTAHWKRQCKETRYITGVADDAKGGNGRNAVDDEDDELLNEAMEIVVRSGLGSTSMLQRKLRVGFARAGRLMDLLERRGVVGPSLGSKAREVLMTEEELDEMEARV